MNVGEKQLLTVEFDTVRPNVTQYPPFGWKLIACIIDSAFDHSSTESAPTPLVSSHDACHAFIAALGHDVVAPNSRASFCRRTRDGSYE